jgi:hypothetical protein
MEEGAVPILVEVKTSTSSFEVRAVSSWRVSRLKQVVETHLHVDSDHQTRLLHGGRVLSAEGTLGEVLLQLHEGKAVVHAAVSEKVPDDVVIQVQDRHLEGFERFRESGFSTEEIEDMRNQVRTSGEGERKLFILLFNPCFC